MSDRDTLISFGFAPERVDWALKSTGNRGLQSALDFLSENEDKPTPTDLSEIKEQKPPLSSAAAGDDDDDEELAALRAAYGNPAGGSSATGEEDGAVAKSIKCTQCGKIFKNADFANFHAEKSGHDQFEESTEEIKPLTEEEKKEKLAELKARMAEKRAQKSVLEAQEAKANEAIRRKGGKDLTLIKEELKVKEANKEAAQRKQDKIDDAKAKAAIRAQIEADKKARADKAAQERAIREGREYVPTGSTSGPPAAPATSSSASGVKGAEYKDTRLQIRLASGSAPLTTTLPSSSTLTEVAEFVAGQSLAFDVDTVTFTVQFPRKVFSRSDFSKTLKDLGLTPSAVLIAS